MVRSGTKLVGSVVPDSTLKLLLKVDRKKLEELETTVCDILTANSLKALPQAPLDGLLKARVQFSCRAAEALASLCRGLDAAAQGEKETLFVQEPDTRTKLAAAETKMRMVLAGSGWQLLSRVP